MHASIQWGIQKWAVHILHTGICRDIGNNYANNHLIGEMNRVTRSTEKYVYEG